MSIATATDDKQIQFNVDRFTYKCYKSFWLRETHAVRCMGGSRVAEKTKTKEAHHMICGPRKGKGKIV